MTKLLKVFVPRLFSEREFYIAVGMIVLFVSVIPYYLISLVCFLYYHLTGGHATLQEIIFPIRKWSLVIIGCVCVLNQVKIFLFERRILTSKIIEGIYDRIMFVPIWGSFAAFLIFCSTALFSIVGLRFIAPLWPYTMLYSDATIYVLSIASLFIFGVIVKTTGKIAKDADRYLATHFSSIDYWLWVYLLGFMLVKIVAGKNLLKFKGLDKFFKQKCIIVDRTNREGKAQAIIDTREAEDSGYKVLIGSDGRSYTDEPKPFLLGAFSGIEAGMSVCVMVVIDSGKYKRPLKGSISKKKSKNVRILVKSWWNPIWLLKAILLPWANSPRTIHATYSKLIFREENEKPLEYCDKVNRITRQIWEKESYRLAHKPNKIGLFIWAKWNYRSIKRRFA